MRTHWHTSLHRYRFITPRLHYFTNLFFFFFFNFFLTQFFSFHALLDSTSTRIYIKLPSLWITYTSFDFFITLGSLPKEDKIINWSTTEPFSKWRKRGEYTAYTRWWQKIVIRVLRLPRCDTFVQSAKPLQTRFVPLSTLQSTLYRTCNIKEAMRNIKSIAINFTSCIS